MNYRMLLKRVYYSRPVVGIRSIQREISTLIKVLPEFLSKRYRTFNDFDLGGNVKLYYWRLGDASENLGDYLSKIVVCHLKQQIQSTKNDITPTSTIRTMYAIGSILGFRCQDAVVWGSGLLNPDNLYIKRLFFSSLDVRSVRGPKTRKILLEIGKNCPEIYGDPAILMPKVYLPEITQKLYDVSLILHFSENTFHVPEDMPIHRINIVTTEYREVIDNILQSKRIISSSLHGIILAETYGVPAVLLLKEGQNSFKYEDWYYSTDRYNIVIAHTVQEALEIVPMELPDLTQMQEQVLRAFPLDLWGESA